MKSPIFSALYLFSTTFLIHSTKAQTNKVPDTTNINRFEFVQFTDFLGFENDRPNGLMQQEVRFKWALNDNFRVSKNDTNVKFQFFRSLIFPDILINRIDKTKAPVDYRYPALTKTEAGKDSIAPRLTTVDLWKYSNLQIGARLVLFALHTKKFRVHLQGGFRLLRNRPFYADTVKSGIDSGRVSSDFRYVYSFVPNVELYIKTLGKDKKAVRGELNVGVLWIKLKDSYYEQYDAAVVDPFDRTTRFLPVSELGNRHVKPMYAISTRLIKPLTENESNVVFFRINYFLQPGKYKFAEAPAPNPVIQTKSFYNHYLQLQFGVSLGLDDLFKDPKEQKSSVISNGT